MNRARLLTCLIFAMLLLIPAAIGQESDSAIEPQAPDMVNPDAHISFPPPVYVVRDSVDIRGTVTLQTMRNFFVQFRPLKLGMGMSDDSEALDNQWLIATLPGAEHVVDGILGTWNIAALRDGLYEIRLTILTEGDTPEYYRVSPIRVENNPPAFVAEEQMMMAEQTMAEQAVEEQTMEEQTMMEEDVEPAVEPEATATPDPSPRVIAIVNSNVRAGDSTDYAVVGHLLIDQSARIRGISAFRSGWFYIELPSGRTGFIHPNIVQTQGDLSNLPRINPPPLPPTAIPVPTDPPAQQQPQSGVNLRIANVAINPHPAVCGEAYRIDVTVQNNGTANWDGGAAIEVRDTHANSGDRVENTIIGIGQIPAGTSKSFVGHITASTYFSELHNINLYLDVNNEVAETNEGDNHHATAPYILVKGDCN